MNIFAANYITPTDRSSAIGYFYKALANRPSITGAWIDLGKIYASQYRFDDAWKCYKIAIRMNPKHFLVEQMRAKETLLEDKYPEYFEIK